MFKFFGVVNEAITKNNENLPPKEMIEDLKKL